MIGADEVLLARRIHRGDLVARNTLVMANLALAKWVAKRMTCRVHGPGCDDLQAAAFVGLCEAADHYDPERHGGARFSSYAVPAIRDACARCCGGINPAGGVGRSVPTVRPNKLREPAEAAPPEDPILRADLESLGFAEQYVLRRRYGIGAGPAQSLRAIAAELGVPLRMVARIHRKGLAGLRQRYLARHRAW